MRRWLDERAATCGAWVTASTWILPDRRASRDPMASATAPPTPVSISSKTRVGGRAAVRQRDLERQHEPRELAARRHFGEGTGPRAGIGRHPELDAVDPVGPGRHGVGLDLRVETRALELQGAEFAIDRGVEPGRGRDAGLRQAVGRPAIGSSGRLRRRRERGEVGLAGVERLDVSREAVQQCGQVLGRHAVLARRRPEGEEPFLDGLEFARVEIRRLEGLLDGRTGAVERHQDGVERLEARLDEVRSLDGPDAPAGGGGPRRSTTATPRRRRSRRRRAGRPRPSPTAA